MEGINFDSHLMPSPQVRPRRKPQPRHPNGMRRGTRACAECRRRRAKCEYFNSSQICQNCEDRGDTCTPQKPHGSRSSSNMGSTSRALNHQQSQNHHRDESAHSSEHLTTADMDASLGGNDSSYTLDWGSPNPSSPGRRGVDTRQDLFAPPRSGAYMPQREEENDGDVDEELSMAFVSRPMLSALSLLPEVPFRAILASTVGPRHNWAVANFPVIELAPAFRRDYQSLYDKDEYVDSISFDDPATCARSLASLALCVQQSAETPACRELLNRPTKEVVDHMQAMVELILAVEPPEACVEDTNKAREGIESLLLLAQLNKRAGKLRQSLLLARRALSAMIFLPVQNLDAEGVALYLKLWLLDAQLSLHLGIWCYTDHRSDIPFVWQPELLVARLETNACILYKNLVRHHSLEPGERRDETASAVVPKLSELLVAIDATDRRSYLFRTSMFHFNEIGLQRHLPFMISEFSPSRYYSYRTGVGYIHEMLELYIKWNDADTAITNYDELFDFQAFKAALVLILHHLMPMRKTLAANPPPPLALAPPTASETAPASSATTTTSTALPQTTAATNPANPAFPESPHAEQDDKILIETLVETLHNSIAGRPRFSVKEQAFDVLMCLLRVWRYGLSLASSSSSSSASVSLAGLVLDCEPQRWIIPYFGKVQLSRSGSDSAVWTLQVAGSAFTDLTPGLGHESGSVDGLCGDWTRLGPERADGAIDDAEDRDEVGNEGEGGFGAGAGASAAGGAGGAKYEWCMTYRPGPPEERILRLRNKEEIRWWDDIFDSLPTPEPLAT